MKRGDHDLLARKTEPLKDQFFDVFHVSHIHTLTVGGDHNERFLTVVERDRVELYGVENSFYSTGIRISVKRRTEGRGDIKSCKSCF